VTRRQRGDVAGAAGNPPRPPFMQTCIMLICIIMRFVDRTAEMARLDRLVAGDEGALAVLYGRRRIGKTRLLLEWSSRHGGLYRHGFLTLLQGDRMTRKRGALRDTLDTRHFGASFLNC